jgi:hypothetical protein
VASASRKHGFVGGWGVTQAESQDVLPLAMEKNYIKTVPSRFAIQHIAILPKTVMSVLDIVRCDRYPKLPI